MRLSPVLDRPRATYPFVAPRRGEARRRSRAGADVIDFGVGEPREETPAVHPPRASPRRSRPSRSPATRRPRACPSCARRSRRGSRGASARRSTPTPRSSRRSAPRRRSSAWPRSSAARARGSRVTTPGYPVPARGALFAGAEVRRAARSTAAHGWLPDLDAVDWDGVAILWLNSPNNPTAVAAPLAFYERAAALPRAHGFVLACDEAYSRAVVRRRRRRRARCRSPTARTCSSFNTLSKRSSMPGYRSGFAAGDPELVAALKRYRPNVGTAPPDVRPARGGRRVGRRGARRRDPRALRAPSATSLLPALRATGLEPAGGDATFFLWLRVPATATPRRSRCALLDELGIVVAPGPFFGAGGEGHVRAALVPTLDECRRAAELARARGLASVRMTHDRPHRARRPHRGALRAARPSDLDDDAARDRRAGHDDARRGRDPRRRADRRPAGRSTSGPRRRSCCRSAPAGWRRSRSGRTSTTTRCRSRRAGPRRACASCRPRPRATAPTSRRASCSCRPT